jgi:hypothetical protein
MISGLDKNLFCSLGECSNRTAAFETSPYQWYLNGDSMEIVQFKENSTEMIYGFLAYAFLNEEGTKFVNNTGGLMPFDRNEFFSVDECGLYQDARSFGKKFSTNKNERLDFTVVYSHFSWFKINGYEKEVILPTSNYDLSRPNVIPLSYAYKKTDYRCKTYLLFYELNSLTQSEADENSVFYDYKICSILSNAYKTKLSNFVWSKNKIHKITDVDVMDIDCYAFCKDDFTNNELLCVVPRDVEDNNDNGSKWLLYENKDASYEKPITDITGGGEKMLELSDITITTPTVNLVKGSNITSYPILGKDELHRQYPLTIDEAFKVDVLGTEMNAKILTIDKPSMIPNIPNDWTKAQGNDYECDEDDSELPEDSLPLPDDYIPEITCVKENKQVVMELAPLLEMASGETFDTVIIDCSKKILNVEKDSQVEADELELIQKENPENIVILSNYIKYPFSVILHKYKYNDFCIVRNDYKFNDVGNLFKKNYCYVHIFSKYMIPNHFGNAILDYERLCIVLSDMAFGEKYLIINNQILSELLHNKLKIQLYTNEAFIDRFYKDSYENNDKLIVGKNGQRQFFE